LFVAIGDPARIAFIEIYPDESQESACRFLALLHAYYVKLGMAPRPS
jgi:hypothetical protein